MSSPNMSYDACRSRRPNPAGAVAAVSLLTALAAAGHAEVRFEDVTDGSGVEYTGESWGASWGYANDDPLPDLFVNHHRNQPGLYINLGNGTFENRAFEIDAWQLTPRSDTHGGTFADYDNDGDADLVVTAGSKNSTQFLVNNGIVLTDRIQDFTFDQVFFGGRFPFWFDYSNDGLLDLALGVQNGPVQLHEQVDGDFARRNFVSGQQCYDHDYMQLSDWTFDGRLDWLCVSPTAGPERIYDVTVGVPFLDRSDLADPAINIADTALADFDGDQIMDLLAVRGKVRINGADIVDANSIESHIISTASSNPGLTFASAGDLELEIHWSGPNVSQIFIGANGLNPPQGSPGEPIRFTLQASDPGVHGLKAYDPATDRGIYVGYDPATNTWSFFSTAGGGAFSYTYNYLRSTAPVSNLEFFGLLPFEQPIKPALLKYTNGRFTDQIDGTGLDHGVQCNAVAAFDADNDMDVDLYYVCRGGVSNLPNRLYLNDGTGRFTPAAAPHGAEGPVGPGTGLGENVVASDYDVDGFVDLFVTNGAKIFPSLPGYEAGGPDKLFRNTSKASGNTNNWVQIDLTGVASNRDGIGATVTATAGGITQKREQNGGYHRVAQHDKRLHFGLAANETVDIEVSWPSGQIDRFFDVTANAVYEVVEGSLDIEPVTIPDTVPPSGCSPAANPPVYDLDVDQAVFLWKDTCTSLNWKLRTSGGAGPVASFIGDVKSQLDFTSVAGVLLEPSDAVDFLSDPTRIEYDLLVGPGAQDGVDFTVDPAASTCFGTISNVPVVYVGAGKTPVSVPFDLDTLMPCGGSDTGVTVSVDDVSVNETSPAGSAAFTVSLNSVSAEDISVDYATVDGSAKAGEDYVAVAGSLTFLAGEQTKTVSIDILDDAEPEAAETFSLLLSNAIGAQLGDSSGSATIFDDELSPCGKPDYDLGIDQAVFLWQNCTDGTWSIRMTGGGQVAATFLGALTSNEPFTSVTGIGLETSDVLDTSDATRVAFELIVSGPRQDGIDATVPKAASLCFDLALPDLPVYVGSNRQTAAVPFNPKTLGSCTTPAQADLVTVNALASSDTTPAELDVVTFEITVSNNGPLEASNVSLASMLPAGLSATANHGLVTAGVYDGATWSIGTLPAAASATLTLEGSVEVGQGGASIMSTTTAAAGDQPDLSTAGDDLTETVRVEGGSDIPIVDWLSSFGGVNIAGNTIVYSGAPTGWYQNSVTSVPFSSLGVFDEYSVRWTVSGDPAATTWVVGLGVTETNRDWRDVDYGFRSSNGALEVRESGKWRLSDGSLSVGDQLSIAVSGSQLQYFLNGKVLYTRPITGNEDFYIDSSFKSGAITLGEFVIATN